ncbi:MAG: nitroreductase family protein [Phycisphaerae bacterium]|jgi:nitroreductase|nr:nitroreductase family protein [Phycisphaerae bacterium]
MNAYDAIISRRSRRQFANNDVPRETVEKLVYAGRLAASANNEQPWEFVIVTDADTRAKLAGIADYGSFIADSPLCIVVFCKATKYYLEDGSAATENILLAAHALGLGACWVAGDKKSYCTEVEELLSAPPGFRLISMIAVGYAVGPVPNPVKRGLGDVIHWEKF